MREFVKKIDHCYNIYPNPKLPSDVSLAKRWIVQIYLPEIKITHLENSKLDEFYVAFDNRLIVKRSQYSLDLGFNLFGFGFGLSRKTDKMLELDAQTIKAIQKNTGA